MAEVNFLDGGVVAVDAGKELVPEGSPVEAKGWAYLYAPQSGMYRVLVELPDGSTVEAARATVTPAKGQSAFLAVRTQVTMKDAEEVPQKPALEMERI